MVGTDVWYSDTVVQWYSGTVVQWYSGRERTSTCMGVRSYLQANLKTSSLAGCLSPVGIMDEVVHRCWDGWNCSASSMSISRY